ncbi:MAG: iron ABC transporter substrate-binding protein [Ignisphaera sp.]
MTRILTAIVVAIALILIAILAIVIVNYFNPLKNKDATSSGNFIIIEDFIGRSIKIPTNIQRVVALGPGSLRLLSYLNALDLVVGVEEVEHTWSAIGRDYAMAYGDKLKNLPIVGPGGPRSAPDPEKIRAVKPDIVIMGLTYVDLYNPDRLSEEVNAPVIVVDYGSAGYLDLESFKKALKLLGRILNREYRAEELCKFIDVITADLKRRTENIASKPSIYVGAISYKGKQPFTSSQSNFPPLILLNTTSIVDKVSDKFGFVSIDFEYILSMQPDIVFIDLNNLDVVLEDYVKDPTKYCSLKAFKEGKVYAILPFNYYHTNIATALADAYYMGKIIYLDKFTDIDPEAKANEVFKVFLGKELYEDFVKGLGKGFASLSDLFKCSR